MKLSTKGRYGLRALIDLAQHGGGGRIWMTELAQKGEDWGGRLEGLSMHYWLCDQAGGADDEASAEI